MIENTIENKRKFFYLYYGQKILSYDGAEFEFPVTDCRLNDYLLLKPLSCFSITDEDAIETARMNTSINWNSGGKEEIWKSSFGDTVVSNGSGIIQEYGQTIVTRIEWLNLEQIDFLRSKGYGLPYMGLSIETMVERGWIKLKEIKR